MAVAQPTQAIQTNFGDIVQRGVSNVQAAEERAYQRQEQERQKALDFEDRYGIPEELFQLEDTEFRTLNDVTTESLSMARDAYYEAYKALEKDPTNVELKKKLGKIKNTVSVLGMNHEKMKALGEKYVKMLAEDKVSGVYEDEVKNMLEGYDKGLVKTKFDEDGNFQYLFYDKKGKLQDVKSYTEIGRYDFAEKINVDAELKTLMENVGSDTITEKQGNYLVTKNVFGDRQRDAVSDYIDSQLGTDEESLEENDVLADLLYQATGGSIKKKENFTEDERQLVKEWMMGRAMNRYNQETKMQADPISLNDRRAAASGSGKDTRTGADLIEVATVGDSAQRTSDGSVVYTLGKPSPISATKSDRRVNRIQYNPNTGAIELEAEDRIKLKGVQEANSIKKEKPDSIIEELMMPDGTTTYYLVDPYVISSTNETGAKEINTFANYNNLGNMKQLTKTLIDKYESEYGEMNLERVEQQPTIDTDSVKKDAFGNPIK